jgi:hypothetical protein
VVGEIGRTVGNVAGPVLGQAGSESPVAQQRALVGGAFDRVSMLASSVAASPGTLLDLRRLRLSLLVDAHRAELARDGDGNVVRRDRLVAVEPDAASLAAAARAGFRIVSDRPTRLGLRLVTLAVPAKNEPAQGARPIAPGRPWDRRRL